MLQEKQARNNPEVQAATCNVYRWVTEFTKTHNPHWVEEGRRSAHEPFPKLEHIACVFEILDSDERILWFEKSRDMMLSWCCVAYFTKQAMTVPAREILFQTQKEDKAKELVRYAKTLYDMQPEWLKEAFPLSKPVWKQPELELHFENGGSIVGIPGGANQIRSYHPWGYLLDEASFVTEAGECYNEALSAVRGKIVLNSSAGPGWYADARHDIIRTDEF